MRKIIDPSKGVKDATGAFLPLEEQKAPEPISTPNDITTDTLLQKGLVNIDRLMRIISQDIVSGEPSRNTVMNLKDCMTMLHEYRELEAQILESLPDEKLEEIAKKE